MQRPARAWRATVLHGRWPRATPPDVYTPPAAGSSPTSGWAWRHRAVPASDWLAGVGDASPVSGRQLDHATKLRRGSSPTPGRTPPTLQVEPPPSSRPGRTALPQIADSGAGRPLTNPPCFGDIFLFPHSFV